MHEILIIGAGPLGLATALALHARGHAVRVLEAREADAPLDARTLALSEGSRQLLAQRHAWPAQATPITHIDISQQGGFGRTQLAAEDYGLPALGHVVSAAALIESLRGACAHTGIDIDYGVRVIDTHLTPHGIAVRTEAGTREAKLVCHAEGAVDDRAAWCRDYQQDAIICHATPAQPHRHRAHERFTRSGPYALLPSGEGYAVVVTAPRAEAGDLVEASDADFLALLHAAFGSRVQLTHASPRRRYPLRLRVRKSVVGPRTVWLGNAAQTLHPVAGQGFNLALRDAWSLAHLLTPTEDPGGAVLERFNRTRRLDRFGTVGFTDALIHLFANDNPLLRHARGLGLAALELAPPLKHFIARRMMFGARGG